MSAVEIPNLKLAKVGPRRKPRAVGLPWLPEAHKEGLTLKAVLGCKVGVLTLIGSVTSAAIGLGNSLAPDYQRFQSQMSAQAAGAKVAGLKYQYDEKDLVDLPGGKRRRDSVRMVSGGFGFIKRQQEAEIASRQADDVGGSAADAASPQTASPQPIDVNAIAKAMGAGGFDGAAPGQAGAKTGLQAPKPGFIQQAAAPRLGGGSGMAGGMGRSFDAPRFRTPPKDALVAAAPKTAATRIAAKSQTPYAGDRGRTLSARQLYRANHYSSLSRGGGSETRSTLASEPFDNSGNSGDLVSGAGAAAGAAPTDSSPEANPSENSSGSGGAPQSEPAPQEAKGKSADPTAWIVKTLQALSWAISLCLILKAIYNAASWWPPSTFMSMTMTNIIIGLGVLMAGFGIALMAMGRPVLGGIYTAVGALVGVLAYVGTFNVSGPALVSWISAAVFAGIPFLNQKSFDGGVDTKKYKDHLGFMD